MAGCITLIKNLDELVLFAMEAIIRQNRTVVATFWRLQVCLRANDLSGRFGIREEELRTTMRAGGNPQWLNWLAFPVQVSTLHGVGRWYMTFISHVTTCSSNKCRSQ